jgi:NAD(P)-dependent dehydrogenase (short-subunit alcohol dehydrogenase family)
MLEGKAGLVTGAGQGIGRRIALELARQGARAVAVADLDVANAEETAALVREAGAGAEAIEVNLRNGRQIEAMVVHAAQSFDGLDLLFNIAGVIETALSHECAVDTLPEDAWDAVYEVNLKAVWLTTKFGGSSALGSTEIVLVSR